MRCRRVRRVVLGEGAARPAEIEDHLKTCVQCAAYARDWTRLQAGLAGMADEPAPEPSLGFATRLARRLQESADESRAREVSFERTGRRFVMAALMVMALLMLGLLIPASSPVRVQSAAEFEVSQPEATAAQNYPLFSSQAADTDFEFASAPEGH
jgi:anti-sigma factor RsiW